MVPPTRNSVTYHLTVRDYPVNYAGKKRAALATKGKIPAPALWFTEGDTAVLYVHNRTNHTVSFHWHGILFPNEFEGVPMLTTKLTEPGETYLISGHASVWYENGKENPAHTPPHQDYFKLAGDMRAMSKSLDMTMGKAPPKIPETKVFHQVKHPCHIIWISMRCPKGIICNSGCSSCNIYYYRSRFS